MLRYACWWNCCLSTGFLANLYSVKATTCFACRHWQVWWLLCDWWAPNTSAPSGSRWWQRSAQAYDTERTSLCSAASQYTHLHFKVTWKLQVNDVLCHFVFCIVAKKGQFWKLKIVFWKCLLMPELRYWRRTAEWQPSVTITLIFIAYNLQITLIFKYSHI